MPDSPLLTPDERKLRKLVEERQRLQSVIDTAVARQRRTGATWATIGKLLGITTEGARKRYGARGGAIIPIPPR
jgi:hypothetical protein